jgi:hypothetical protein
LFAVLLGAWACRASRSRGFQAAFGLCLAVATLCGVLLV